VELLLCGALAHSKMGNLVEVKEYFDQLESVKSNLAVVPLTMGFICQETKALINDAKAHLEKAESIASAGGKRLMLTQVRHLQSNVIRQLRIEDVQAAAEQLMQESWEEYTDLNCIEGEAQVLDTIGNQLMQNEKLVEAEEYFVRSLTLKRQIHDFPGQAITLGNLSRLHFIKSDSSQWSKAENAASHNFAISNEIHEIKGMVIGSHMLGLICLARFDLISNQDQRHDLLEKAQLAFDNELDASKLSTNPWGVFLAHTGYLQVAIRESDWGKAEKLLQKMGRMCGETGVDYATPVQAFWRAIVQYQSSRIAPRHKAMSQVWSCYEKVKPFGGGTIYEQFRALGLFHTATQQNRSLPEPLKDKIVKELEERRKANLFSFLFK